MAVTIIPPAAWPDGAGYCWGRAAVVVTAGVMAAGRFDRGRAAGVWPVAGRACRLGKGQPGELGGGAGVRGRARLRRRGWAGGGVQAFGGGLGGGGLGGVLLGFAESGDGFGECCQLGDEHDRGHVLVAGQVGEYGQ